MNKLKLMTIIGTRPEIIRLSAVIKKCDVYFDQILVHTGQNYDYNLNQVFFEDLGLRAPDFYLDAVGKDLGETIGNIIAKSYSLMVEQKPDALLILGDTNSCLSAIAAKRLHIPIFHMEAGNRCFDECLPEETNRRIVDHISDVNMCYSEHARRYLNAEGTAKERTFVTGSPMAEVLHANLAKIEASDVLERLGLEPHKYMLLSAHREENIDTRAELYRPVHLHQPPGRDLRHADSVLLPPAQQKATGRHGLPAGRARKAARAPGLPRLQPPADERLCRGLAIPAPCRRNPASLPAWDIRSRRSASVPPPSDLKHWTKAALCWPASARAAWSRRLPPPLP